ncbi:hypothetical protein [Limnoraphis robusta]|uniref:DUF4178 domain-containing protein n=1 Tax=Limnoraphis robusta CCNP1315 TaxID=3110306 RepID=A0ABU5U732_9CYAN|nr:hypothetical protein [Limnoraphis robusta]MEA5522672.1 hypothetical protein [Limnoraphis robusta CCNP1315]MEA5547545.1 hypothetical protein [Limnoraphis robusta CCNP1324]
MSKLIKRLDISAHPRLEQSLGYTAENRWVAWHWEPDLEQPFYTDGQTTGASNSLAWQVFLEHPQVSYDLDNYELAETERYWLLLDRKTRNFYIGEGKIIQSLLEQPEGLGLLASLDGNSNPIRDTRYAVRQLTRFNPFRSWFKLIPIGLGAALIASFGMTHWSSLLSPQAEQKQAIQPLPVTPVVPTGNCGVGGSEDFSGYVTSASGDKELHLVGVYESHPHHSGNNHPTGEIQVKVKRQDKPIILALSSYEPVNWNVQVEPGVEIEKIIVNGYHDQKVTGVSDSKIPIEEYSHEGTGKYLENFTYQWSSAENQGTPALVTQLSQLTGTQLTSFQGCYRGTQFEIQ